MNRNMFLFISALMVAVIALSGEDAPERTVQQIQGDIAKGMRDIAPHRQVEAVKNDAVLLEANKEVGEAARNYYQFEGSCTREARNADKFLEAVGLTLGLLRKEVDDLNREINALKALPEDQRDAEVLKTKEETLAAKNTELRPLFGPYNREAHSKAYTLPGLMEAVVNRKGHGGGHHTPSRHRPRDPVPDGRGTQGAVGHGGNRDLPHQRGV